MKNLKVYFLAMLSIILFGCDRDSFVEDQSSQNGISLEIIEKIKAMGYNVDAIPPFESKDEFTVEGDINISKKDVEEFNFQKQFYFSLVSCGNVKNIRVKNNLGNNAAGKALPQAIKRWNAVSGSSLKFVLVNKNHDLVVRRANPREILSEVKSFAAAGQPSSGKVGKRIRINLNFTRDDVNNNNVLNQKQWVNVLTHELGHAIGLVHTDFPGRNPRVAGTPEIDRKSIMTSSFDNPQIVLKSKGLSKFDEIATRKMYNTKNTALCNNR